LYAIARMEPLVDPSDRSHAVGRDGQLRSDLGIRRLAALQRKQAYDHLQAVQQPMIGLPAQNFPLLDQLVFLAKQSLFSYERPSQADFRAPEFCKLAFVVRHRAAPNGARMCVRAERQLIRSHVVSLPCAVRNSLP
jgi:hypothetical protein